MNELRDELLEWIQQVEEPIGKLKKEVKALAESQEKVCRLMTIPGIESMTGLYATLSLGPVQRFARAKQVVSYVGLDSVEPSADNLHRPRRYGKISKQETASYAGC